MTTTSGPEAMVQHRALRRVRAPTTRAPGPAVRAPAVRAPAVRAPAVRAPAVRAPAVRAPAVREPTTAEPEDVPREAAESLALQWKDAKAARDHAQRLRRQLAKAKDLGEQQELQAKLEEATKHQDELRLSEIHLPSRRPKQLGSQIDIDMTFNSTRQGSTM